MKYSKFMKIDKIIVKTKETTYPIMVGNGAISLLKVQINKLCPNTKKIAVIPIGSIEQHGPHLPISTDSDIVSEVARKLSEKNGYLLLPTITYGNSFEHAPFFNLSIRESTLRTILIDLCTSLLENNIKTIFIIND